MIGAFFSINGEKPIARLSSGHLKLNRYIEISSSLGVEGCCHSPEQESHVFDLSLHGLSLGDSFEVAIPPKILIFDKNSLLDELKIRKTELNVKKKNHIVKPI